MTGLEPRPYLAAMSRLSALTFSFGLAALLLAAPACDGNNDDDDTGSTGDTAGETTDTTGETETASETGDTGELVCGDEWAEKAAGGKDIMGEWGHACTQDDECVALLGDGAACVHDILGIYDLPGGYCSRNGCELPDASTTVVLDSADCSGGGGVACLGVKDIYTVCAVPCSSHDECGREGYGCRIMPNIAAEGDQTFCLMDAQSCCTTDSGECG